MAKRPTIETERLVLRPFTLDDASAVQELAGEWEIAANTLNMPHPYEDGMAEEWIGGHQAACDEGKELTLAIVRGENCQLIGAMGLMLALEHYRGELRYWIGRPYWNQGYCTEAVRAIVDYGFEELGLNRIEAWHFAQNLASGRVMQKTGMLREGRMRQRAKRWDEFKDMEFYAILRSDWAQGRER
ncbi:MAG: N-acetyltransferase, partial [Anaerolineales bacterium]